MSLNTDVRSFWEGEPCGTGESITGDLEEGSREWYERIESHRYAVEPFIHSIAQFTRHSGKQVLEVGVGAGTDHLQWARAGCETWGVDLTAAAIEVTRKHLSLYGLSSNLQQVNAEVLPFDDKSFDVVYSWGVIHHSESPQEIVSEIQRVLRPGGLFIGMIYGLYSPAFLTLWAKHALLKGKPWRSFSDIVWNHVESIGTKAYTNAGARELFSVFDKVSTERIITVYDKLKWPRWISSMFPNSRGCFIAVRAKK